jgi:hypothetical protein
MRVSQGIGVVQNLDNFYHSVSTAQYRELEAQLINFELFPT